MQQSLSFKQKQLPRLSMQTWLPLLQCSLTDLDKHIGNIALENPCLDVKSSIEISQSSSAKGYATYQNYVSNASSDEIEWMSVSKKSLYEVLDEQIAAPLFPTPISQEIASQILFYINDDGYFEGDIENIAEVCHTDAYKVEQVRQRFAYLEPTGIGARDYKESFLFQLNDYDMDEELSLLLSAILLQFEKIEKFLKHPRFSEAKHIIKHLKTPPAIDYKEDEQQIIPDVYVDFKADKLQVRINNDYYPDIEVTQVSKYDNFAKKKFKEAREIVNLLDLRKATLYNITLLLIEKQHSFFMGGVLHPLKLQDIADELGFNESTISRSISNKYLECDAGVFAFKDFFSNAIGEVSTAEIKDFLKRLVVSENQEKPYSDKYLHEKIEERFNVKMVRRSIAKYRNEMDIPAYRERKFLYKLSAL